MDPLITTNRDAIRRIATHHGARNVRVFGSRARGDAEESSDVDLLIEAGPKRSFFFPGGLIADLEDLLGCRVQVVTEQALHPALREQVLREAEPV
ncbi:MAG: nucleotidyltransferase [Bacteroidetes bacterium]|nr:nucleotidyltransferase [Bacteroidota bacterium]